MAPADAVHASLRRSGLQSPEGRARETADEVPSGNISAFIERDLIEDAWDCEDDEM